MAFSARSAPDPFLLAADLLTPPKQDVFAILEYTPNCRVVKEAQAAGLVAKPCGECPQEQFHKATEFDVLYGGAAGGGKTLALVVEGIRAAVDHPGIRILVVRRTYDELAESVFPELRRYAYAEAFGAKWNKTEKELTFPSGSVIRFRYLENLESASRRQGGGYQLLLVDERTLLAPGVVDILIHERLRSASHIPVIGVRSTCNPGGPSHAEVKSGYIDATEHGKKVLVSKTGVARRFIPAKATDNPYLGAEYYAMLDSIPDPQRRAAMRDGSWDVFDGQVFTEWLFDRHVVRPFDVPVEWDRFMGVDYGYAAPWAAIWGALDSDRRLWIYRELYEKQVGAREQAQKILRVEDGEDVLGRYADPAMWGKHDDGPSVAEIYGEVGVHLERADNSRLQGLHQIHERLAEMPACQMHRNLGWETCPKMHVFESCTNLIRTLPSLPYSKMATQLEDVNTKAEDHAYDAARYLTMGIDRGPKFHSNQPTDAPATRALDGTMLAEPFGRYAIPARRDLWR